MDKVSEKKVVVFGLVVVSALGLVTWGFAALRAGIGDGYLVLAGDEESEESFGGVGLEIAKMDGSITVVRTLDGTPADRVGVRAGDRIVKVNDEPVGDDPDIRDVVSKLRGKPETEVTVTVKRGDETKTFTIPREKIKAPRPRVTFFEPKKRPIRKQKPQEFWPFEEEWWGPEEFSPFDEMWPWVRHGDKDALEEYREALAKLREARKKLWRSFPRPEVPGWEFPRGRLHSFALPERPGEGRELRMEMDVRETDDAITVKCDIPGMKKEDIDISLKGNLLTIKGERNVEEETKDEKGRVVRRERTFGSFSRSFTIPGSIKTENIKTSYEDGVLTIVIPKEKPKPEKEKEIKIMIDTL